MDRNDAFLPYDNRSLLTTVMTRLDSFEHDILYAEDSPIELLRNQEQETEQRGNEKQDTKTRRNKAQETVLRRFISNWVRGRDRGVFDFTQEAVVVDEKRTDIRFHPYNMPGVYATVELKRQTWSVPQLEHALSNQLVRQYLQHDRCRVGCLLICMSKKKKWHHPHTCLLYTSPSPRDRG